MAQTLGLSNFEEANILEASRLNADVAAGVNAILTNSNQGIVANDWLVIGELGSETCELTQVSTVTGNVNITLTGNLKLPHKQFARITKLFGNKFKVYSAPNVDGTTPAVTAFTALSGGIIDIDVDQLVTQFTDPAGSASVWYRYVYYNSVTAAETDLSISRASSGIITHYALTDDVRREAGLEYAPYVSDTAINDARDAAEDEVNGVIQSQYVVPLQKPINGVIVQITKQLAAGFVLTSVSGSTINTTQKGKDKISDARAQLQKIASKQIRLLNQIGVDVSKGGGGSMVGTGPDTDPMFTIAGKF